MERQRVCLGRTVRFKFKYTSVCVLGKGVGERGDYEAARQYGSERERARARERQKQRRVCRGG